MKRSRGDMSMAIRSTLQVRWNLTWEQIARAYLDRYTKLDDRILVHPRIRAALSGLKPEESLRPADVAGAASLGASSEPV